jgi:hypothetical protein
MGCSAAENGLHTGRLLGSRSICDLAVGIHDDRSFAESDRLALFLLDFLFVTSKTLD